MSKQIQGLQSGPALALTGIAMIAIHEAAHPIVSVSTGAAAPEAKQGFSFDDFLDIINPLQHLPVVSTLYQKLTGDRMGDPAKLIGDLLYGGPLGLASSLADTAFEKITGKNVGDTVLGWLDGGDSDNVALADNTPLAAGELSNSAPHVVFAEGSELQNEATITAALNRSQFDRAVAARTAYARGYALTQSAGVPVAAL
jgi:hypothetical protein